MAKRAIAAALIFQDEMAQVGGGGDRCSVGGDQCSVNGDQYSVFGDQLDGVDRD